MRCIGLILGITGMVLMAGCAHVPAGNPDRAPKIKQVAYLTGKSQKQVSRVMGKPVVERLEEPNLLWAYHDKGCSTLVYFDAQGVCQHAEMRGTCERKLASIF